MNVVNQPLSMPVVTPTEGIYTIVAANAESIAPDSTATWQKIWIYPAKGASGGELTANSGAIKVGLSATYLRDARAATDTDYPIIYELPLGMRMPLSRIYVKGTEEDGVFYSYV